MRGLREVSERFVRGLEFDQLLQRMDEEALLRESGETGKVFRPGTGSGKPRVYSDRT